MKSNVQEALMAWSTPGLVHERMRYSAHFSIACTSCGGHFHAKLQQGEDDPTPAAQVQRISGVVGCYHCGNRVKVVMAKGVVISLAAA